MIKRLILILSILLSIHSLTIAQNKSHRLSGTVFEQDSKELIDYASVRILNQRDSAYVGGASTNEKGAFNINLKPGQYIVKVSFLGFDDYFQNINFTQTTKLDNIYLQENSILLSEAIVEAKVIEIAMKGDTIEYNADAYKVQETAVVEDLLKKMPGVVIDENGKITVNGKEVKKIMVDGKEFFSDDPKVASKNLPAKMVQTLQVLDQKSDMSLMTGFDDGEEETVINLTVKKGMKEGVFGSAMAGYGERGRYEGSGMANYMRDNTQVSVLGGVNNTNNAGASDLASAMFGGSDGGRGPRGLRFGGRNGITKSINGGLNFATEYSDKLKWGGDFRYGNTDNTVTSSSLTEYTSIDKQQRETSNAWGNNRNESFAGNLKFEWTPDSLTKIIFRPSFQYNTSDNLQSSDGETSFLDQEEKNYSTTSNYYSDSKGYKLDGRLDISRKLNNKGRVVSVGLRGGYNSSEDNGLDYTKIEYASRPDSIIDQQFFQDDKSYNWRIFASYVEPLGRNNFLELSYNISNNNSTTDKNTYYNVNAEGVEPPSYTELDPLYTRYIKNDFINQNASIQFKSQRTKFNYTIGVGLEPSSSKTALTEPGKTEVDLPRRNFLSFAPSGQFNYLFSKRSNLRIDYRSSTSQPTTLQLYDGVYSRTGMNTTSGNPDLKPSFQNRINIRFRNSNPEQASFMALFGGFNFTSNAIVSTTVRNDEGGRDMTYNNVDGNMGGNLRFMFNRPLRNRNWSINSMSYVSYDINNTLINNDKNKAKTLSLQENVGLQFRSTLIDFALRGNIRYGNMRNSISTNNNRNTFDYGATYDFTLQVPKSVALESNKHSIGSYNYKFTFKNITLDSDINYSTNSGYSDGFELSEWLWNMSVSATVFEDKFGSALLRFKAYDVLKERSNISRTYASDYIRDTTSNTISSYFMFSFVYKFQFFKGGAKQDDMGGDSRGMRGGGRPQP